MDKNQTIGLVLIALLLIGYSYFFAPTPGQPPQPVAENSTTTTRPSDTAAVQQQPTLQAGPDQQQIDSLEQELKRQKFGVFAGAMNGTEQTFTVETEKLRVTFSNRGGAIEQVELKNYKTYWQEPLVLYKRNDENSESLLVQIPTRTIDLKNFYFQTASSSATVGANDSLQVVFSLDLPDGSTIKQQYKLFGDKFRINYNLQGQQLGSTLASNRMVYTWKKRQELFENDIDESRRRSSLNYHTVSDEGDNISPGSDMDEELLTTPVKWLSMKQRFFSSAVIAETRFDSAYVYAQVPENDEKTVRNVRIRANLSAASLNNMNAGFTYYFGPNEYNLMKGIAPGFEENVYFGYPIIELFGKYLVYPVFNFLENYIGNYGIIIIILVVLIRILLSPLTYRSYMSMAKTKVLKPEMDELKEKYGDDQQKIQSETMKLYQKVGVNPISGCIPLLLQMPFLLAMFQFFPNAIAFRQEGFLWAEDLSTYDSIFSLPFTIPAYGDHVSLFTILMTASTILTVQFNSQAATVQGPMKSIQYFMPLIFMFVLNSFPAALNFYYLISNITTFGQQQIIKRFVDDEKIRKILEENKKRNKNKKKSKFQLRLEEAMKAGEQAQANKQAKNTNNNNNNNKQQNRQPSKRRGRR